MKKILTTLGVVGSLLLFTSYSDRNALDKYSLESGINITTTQQTPFSKKERDAIDKIVREGYSGINIDVGYYQDTQTSSTINPNPEISIQHLEDLISYSESKNLKIYIRPLINNLDESSRKENIPEDIDKWFEEYTCILTKLVDISTKSSSKKSFDFYISSELDSLLITNPQRFAKLAEDMRATGFEGKLIHSIIFNYDLDKEKIEILNTIPVDIIGIDFYVSMTNNALSRENKFHEARYYINEILKTSTKPVIFTELGYRSIINGEIKPWSHKEINQTTDYEAQRFAYQNFLKALLMKDFQTEKNLGVFYWITDTQDYASDIFLSEKDRKDGYSFFGKPTEDIVKDFNKKRLFSKYYN